MVAASSRGAENMAYGHWLARLVLALLIGTLLSSPLQDWAAEMSRAPTFQFKDAKTPAESVDSIKLLERALELTQTALGPDDSVVGDLAHRLAQRYDDAGDYEKALRLYERSLAIKEKALGPEDPGVGECLNDLGCLQQGLENYDEALRLFQRSLVVTEKAYGAEHPEVATTLSSMAEVYCSKSEYSEALRVGERALRIREKALGKEHPDVADSLAGLADIYRGMGNTTKALLLAQQSLAIMEKQLGPDHPLVAECLVTLADVQKDRSNFGQAIAMQQRALAINEKISGPNHPDVFRNLSSLAQLYAMTGDSQRSISSLVDLSTHQRRYLAQHFQTASWVVASRVAEVFRSSSEMLQSLSATQTTNKTARIARDAAENSALSKALWEEAQAARAALEADKEIRSGELYSQYQSVQSELTRLPEKEPDQAKRDVRRNELEANLSQILSELAQRVGLAAQRVLEQNLSLADIAGQLPTESVLADFVQYRQYDFTAKSNQWREQRYAVYLTLPLAHNSTNLNVERVDLGEAAPIDEAVSLICKRMSAGQYEAKDLAPARQRLAELVYAPLAKHLTNVSHLIVCPDGQLSRLPFEMLSPSSDFGSTDRHKFLIEEKTISYVTSGREIVRLQSRSGVSPDPNLPGATTNAAGQAGRPSYVGSALVMGGPDFDLDLSKAGSASFQLAGSAGIPARSSTDAKQDALPLAGRMPALRSLSRDYRGIKFPPLPGAEAEARSVAKLLGGDCVLRVGPDAREAELKAAVSPRVLHLATHGFFLSDQDFKRTNALRDVRIGNSGTRWNASLPKDDWENPLVRCGIALAGANRAGQITNALAEDGVLTGLEASLLNLQGTELVILSACDSGTGEVKIGEGVMSLRRAFRIAGAQTVLASHWKVSDKATSQLMTEFIRRWRSGEPRAKAWREAQLSLLHSKEYSNPYFWAAFTLTGQWN
jgi:CHAT domain-containing protein